MKRAATLLIILFATIGLFAQTNQTDSKGKQHGLWKKYDDKGNLLYEGNFNHGVPVGTFHYYYSNGKLKSTTLFIEGTHKVHTSMYDVNEKLASEGNFIDQIKDSIWNYYNPKGTLIKSEAYRNGQRHGWWRTYSSETGQLLEECHYDNDKANGERKTYFTDGKISTESHYINGDMSGKFTSYFPNGKIFYTGTYLNGLETGEWKYFDENGNPRKSVEYKLGKVQKTFIFLNIGGWQKMNQANIAYFHKEGNQTRVVNTNGKSVMCQQVFEELLTYVDFEDFCIISPTYAASYPAIKAYREIATDYVEVILKPATEEPVVCEGDHAKAVKMLFNNEVPKEN